MLSFLPVVIHLFCFDFPFSIFDSVFRLVSALLIVDDFVQRQKFSVGTLIALQFVLHISSFILHGVKLLALLLLSLCYPPLCMLVQCACVLGRVCARLHEG